MPKVWRSMQLIYYPYKCNTTDIQDTPHMKMAHFTLWLTWLLSVIIHNIEICFLTDPLIFGSLIVRKIAALKGNYFIPKCGCYNDCRNSLSLYIYCIYIKNDHRCALCEWKRVTDSATQLLFYMDTQGFVLDVILLSIQLQYLWWFCVSHLVLFANLLSCWVIDALFFF